MISPRLTVTQDLAYKTGSGLSELERQMCRLDLLAPEGADRLPCFLWLHGGGLTGGDKEGEMAPCRVIAAEGFVVATANYRLHPAVTFPAYAEDAAAAVAWFREHAGEYGGDPEKLFIGGYSAGAYLAALIATDGEYLARHGMTPQQIRRLVLLSGAMATHFTVRAERGIPESTQVVDEAAPLHHAGKETPPCLLLWGSNDKALRAEENLYLAGVLKAAGHDHCKTVQIEGRDHGTIAAEIENPEDPVRREILGFLKSALGS